MNDSIIRFFQDGGTFMFPIAIVLALGLAIAIERLIVLTAARASNRKDFGFLLMCLKRGDLKKAIQHSTSSNSAISDVIAAGLSRLAAGSGRTEIEYAMEERLLEVIPRFEKRTQYLATLANVATLLGLLGTIMGLIDAFTAVASADPAEKAALLSQSISVAMNTTAFGLMVAIPLLLLHAFLQNLTNEIVDSFESAGIKVINLLGQGKRGGEAA
ncbi:MotA/TolQ/ExbB proton channel family protein [Hahella sp. SMD15-11]|uniref:MotA/TolQ/ExbB proton channel family protein n=1 Tax=Thermohahella caldifontis TaxID=3142973 RepID=A0AB39UZU0_9GAMM